MYAHPLSTTPDCLHLPSEASVCKTALYRLPLKAASLGRESNEYNSKHTHRVGRFLEQSGKRPKPNESSKGLQFPTPAGTPLKTTMVTVWRTNAERRMLAYLEHSEGWKLKIWWKSIYTIYHQIPGGCFLEEDSRTLGNWCDTKGGHNYLIHLIYKVHFWCFWYRVIDIQPFFSWNASTVIKRDSWTVGHQCLIQQLESTGPLKESQMPSLQNIWKAVQSWKESTLVF